MKKTIIRIVSTKLGEEIGDFERINFDENNEILILPTKEEISRAASELERSTHFRSNIAAQKTKRLPKKKIEEDKGFRLTASQKQLQLGAKRKRKDAKHAAFKLATRRVDQERAKPKGAQKSTTQIREEVIEETGVEIQSVSTINDYVQKGMVDMTPLKVGKPSKLPQYILKALSSIHLASVRIMQLTGRNKTNHSAKNLTDTLKLCLKKMSIISNYQARIGCCKKSERKQQISSEVLLRRKITLKRIARNGLPKQTCEDGRRLRKNLE